MFILLNPLIVSLSFRFYYLYVIDVGRPNDVETSTFKPEDFSSAKRARRSGTKITYQRVRFGSNELPRTYRLGASESADSPKLQRGHYYKTFLRAFVKSDTGKGGFHQTSSPFSDKVLFGSRTAKQLQDTGTAGKSDGNKTSGNMVMIVGAIAGAVIVILVIIIIVVIFKR